MQDGDAVVPFALGVLQGLHTAGGFLQQSRGGNAVELLAGDVLLVGRALPLHLGDLGVERRQLLLYQNDFLPGLALIGLRLLQLFLLDAQLLLVLFEPALKVVLVFGIGQNLAVRFLDGVCVVVQVVLRHRDLRVAVGLLVFHLGDLLLATVDLHRQLLHLLVSILDAQLVLLQHRLDVGAVVFGQQILAFLLFQLGAGLLHRARPERNFQRLFFFGEFQKAPRLFRLLPQRLQAALQLAHDVLEAKQVFIGVFQLLFRLRLAVAVLADAGGFFKNFPPLAGLGGDNLLDPALPDNRIAVAAKAGIHQQLGDVL